MGKRSKFPVNDLWFYPTPAKAVLPLLPFLKPGTQFVEPFCGDGALVRHLQEHGHTAVFSCDIADRGFGALQSAMDLDLSTVLCDCIITNPPWERKVLHPFLEHFRKFGKSVWVLLDADYMHTKQSAPYMRYCSKVVSVGRVKWIPDSKTTGKDNCCWYCFEPEPAVTLFYGRNWNDKPRA